MESGLGTDGHSAQEAVGEQVVATPWKLYAVVLTIALAIGGAMTYSMLSGARMAHTYAPLVDAAMEVKLNASLAHLWFEEGITSANEKGAGSTVGEDELGKAWEFIGNAEKYAKIMLEGGTTSEGAFNPVEDEELRDGVQKTMVEIQRFRVMAQERWDNRKEAGVGTDIDQQFDRLFDHLLEEADAVETKLQSIIERELALFNVIQTILIVACMILAVIVSVVLSRFVGQRRRAELALQARNWIITGQASLADGMRGEQDPRTLSQNVVTVLAHYLEAKVGAFYIADDDGRLTLEATYAYGMEENLSKTYMPGDGLVGQAALEHKVIVLTDVPEDYLKVHSGVGEVKPVSILIAPMVDDGQVKGVVELGAFREFSDAEVELVNKISESVGVALSTAEARDRVAALLERTQAQAEELEAQQEELKATNEELEEQREELRSSNEELEEQSEELKAANEELEEKTESLEKQKAEIDSRREQVERAKEDVEEKARELAIASRYKSEFLANMSHELRTPLNSLLILSKLLVENEEGNLTAEQVESADVIYNGGQQLLLLINEILDLSKVEAGKMEVHHEPVGLESFAKSMRAQFGPVAEKNGVAFDVVIDDDLPATLVTDGQRLEQILRNFLSNAFKFTPEGSVTLRVSLPDEGVCFDFAGLTPGNALGISVIDTGHGISEDDQKSIFEAFQQADGSTSRRYGGTGLGLSISRALAGLLGGEIHLSSEEGNGSAFTLFLPLDRRLAARAVVALEEAPPPPSRRAIHPKGPQVAESKKAPFLPDDRDDIKEGDRAVLIIEDDADFAKVLMTQSRKKGFKCLVAGDGGSGLQLAADYKPSAIILDLGLPDIDGGVVLDNLKYGLDTRHIPVHVMSARDKNPDFLRKGAIGFLTKPISADDLDAAFGRIENLLSNKVRQVLVVEDDENARKAIAALLESKHVEITGAGTGAEAMRLVGERMFDCIILDIGLPDISGFDMLKTLDEDLSRETPPVIVYTGRELSSAELLEMSRYTTKVIVKDANSPERLIDEASLFLHSVEGSLPSTHQQTLRMLHDPQKLLYGKKVLLVDDDLRNSFALSKVLRHHGLEVVLADNGQLALELLEEDEEICLILMDIMMPVMDGYETMRRIRKQKRFENLPIIALTAKAMVEDRAKCIKAGANDYLAKPIDTDRLASLMRVLLCK
jgi:CheY-like chemotaxis protein